MEEKLVVKKNNDIVRNTINKFSYKQNQLMCILLGKYVHTVKDEALDSIVSIDEFRQIMDIKSDGGNAYSRIKQTVEKFMESSTVGVYDEETKDTFIDLF